METAGTVFRTPERNHTPRRAEGFDTLRNRTSAARNERAILAGRILIVDDNRANLTLLERILARSGFSAIQTTSDPCETVPLFHAFQPDILLLDLHMPAMGGFDVLRAVQNLLPESAYFPILMLTGDMSAAAREHALAHGASDFLLKPYDAMEVILRIRNLLQTRLLHQQIAAQNEQLEARVRERTRDLEEARLEVLERLARAAEYRDDDTRRHTVRVGQNAATLARLVGWDEAAIDLIGRAAPLHDIGKVGIPDSILLKKGKLSEDEFEQVKTHTRIGGDILADGHSTLIQMAERIAQTHHEHWDGNGYPDHLAGEGIPIEGRIVAIVDVFDALVHERPYKAAWPVATAVEWMLERGGKQFDPALLEAFRQGVEQNLFHIA